MGIYGEKKCGNYRKSFYGGIFTEKVFGESFGKFCRKFYRKNLAGKKFYGGKWGTRFELRLGKLLIRHSSS